MNLGDVIQMRVTRVGQDSTLAAMARLLEHARPRAPASPPAPTAWPAGLLRGVLLLAVLSGLCWLHVDPARAFPIVLAVLVVTCPCALSLATPAALAAATMRLARGGLLVARGRALENLAHADRVVFDKTGTLTFGQPRIDRVRTLRAERPALPGHRRGARAPFRASDCPCFRVARSGCYVTGW